MRHLICTGVSKKVERRRPSGLPGRRGQGTGFQDELRVVGLFTLSAQKPTGLIGFTKLTHLVDMFKNGLETRQWII